MYQQHLQTLGQLKCDTCPKTAILDDLAKEITSWQEASNTVIIATDSNKDICSDTLQTFFSQFGLSDVCSTLHGSFLPATQNHGTLPMDGIFAPAALIPMCHAGYLAFGEGVLSNHQALWINIPAGLLHMCHETSPVKAPAWGLQCADPGMVLQYNTLLHECLMEFNVFNRAQVLLQSLTSPHLTKAQQAEYEALDHILVDSKQFSKWHCWKIKAGTIPWCLQVSQSIYRILYWKGLLSKLQGHKIGSSVLCSQARKAGIVHNLFSIHLSPDEIQHHITAAYKSFNRVKKEPFWWDTWIAGLIATQAENSNKSKRVLWKQLQTTEQAQKMVWEVQAALKDQWCNPSLLAVIGPALEGGGHQEFASKAKLEWACIDKAGRWFTQASHTPLLVNPFLHLFSETGSSSTHLKQVLAGNFQSPAVCNPFASLYFISCIALHRWWTFHPALSRPTMLLPGARHKNLLLLLPLVYISVITLLAHLLQTSCFWMP